MKEHLGTQRMRKEARKRKNRKEEKPLYNKIKTNPPHPENSLSFTRFRAFKEEESEIWNRIKQDARDKELKRYKEDTSYLLKEFVERPGRPAVTREIERLHKLLWQDYDIATLSGAGDVAHAVAAIAEFLSSEYGVSVEKVGAEQAMELYFYHRQLPIQSGVANSKNTGKRTHAQALEQKYVRTKSGKLINVLEFKQKTFEANIRRKNSGYLPLTQSSPCEENKSE